MGKKIIKIDRKTTETTLKIEWNLKEDKNYKISTPCGFLNHMLELFCFHGGFSIKFEGKGDIDVDFHHLIEDSGIVFGKAFFEFYKNKQNINRFGCICIPMDEALVQVVCDISGRSMLVWNVEVSGNINSEIDINTIEEFFRAFVRESHITLHINLIYGKNLHHIIEAIYKGTGRILREATQSGYYEGESSSKGCIG